MIGQSVGNYLISKLIGEGGMGAVYLARHPGIGRQAAIKILHPSLVTNPEILNRFLNEARAAHSIRHPGIVEVFDSGTLPTGAPYIVMELLEGESLAARLRRGRMPVDEALELTHQAADALAAAHAQGIVHRDLKPDNLFLARGAATMGGRTVVKVLDFGIAKLGQGANSVSVRTRTGAVMGTPTYMSPEQCRGTREIDHRTDVYSLGVILFEMVCGRPPFVSEGFGEMAHLHISAAPPRPSGLAPGIPAPLEQLIEKALAKEPAARIQSMVELQRGLRWGPARTMVLGARGERGAPETAPALGRSRTTVLPQTTLRESATSIGADDLPIRRSRWPVWAGMVATAAAVAVGVVVVRSDRAPSEPRRVSLQAPAPAASAFVPPPAPAADSPPAPAEEGPSLIDVEIRSNPAGARVVREQDGALLGVTPLKRSWPLATGVEKLRVEKEGFRPETFLVPLDRGVDLNVALRKVPAPARVPRKSASLPPQPTPAASPPAPVQTTPPAPAPPPPKRKDPVPI